MHGRSVGRLVSQHPSVSSFQSESAVAGFLILQPATQQDGWLTRYGRRRQRQGTYSSNTISGGMRRSKSVPAKRAVFPLGDACCWCHARYSITFSRITPRTWGNTARPDRASANPPSPSASMLLIVDPMRVTVSYGTTKRYPSWNDRGPQRTGGAGAKEGGQTRDESRRKGGTPRAQPIRKELRGEGLAYDVPRFQGSPSARGPGCRPRRRRRHSTCSSCVRACVRAVSSVGSLGSLGSVGRAPIDRPARPRS